MEIETYTALGMDFKNLMSCIHYHEDSQDNNVILETLKTIIDICTNESCGQDAFREEGGLDFLVEFLFSTDNTTFLEHALKTLAFVIDENVHSQMYMSKRSVFEVLQTILKKTSFPTAVQKNALALLSTILYHNSTAQNLVFEIGLLQELLNLSEHYAQGLMINSSCMTSNLDNCVLNLWMSINSTLCFAVNNPRNEKNQDICKNIFPTSLKILELPLNSAVMNSVASFLLLTISDNAKCQDYFFSCDGFIVLKRCFQKYFDALVMDMKICNGITGKETYQAINSIVGIISSASLNHEKNAVISGDVGILSMLIKLLFIEAINCQLKTKIILCLGHCVSACCSNKSYILETENFDTFLKKCLQLGDTELSAACKYLLQVCLVHKESFDSNLDCTEYSRFAGISFKYNPGYLNDALMDSFMSKEVQSSVKVPSIRSSSLKVKSNSRSLKKTYSSSSSSCESTAEMKCRRKIPKISRSLNEFSSIKKESLSNSKTVQCDLLSNQQFSSRKKEHSTKEMNQLSPSDDKFSKQNIISDKNTFTDFLSNESQNSNSNFKNKNFLQLDNIKSLSNNLITDWLAYNKTKSNESIKLSTNDHTLAKSLSQDNISNSFSQYNTKLASQNSCQEKCPRLFKKKKKRLSSQQTPSIFSCSSSEYSFTPYNVKNFKKLENENDSQFRYCKPYQPEINFPNPSKNSKNMNDNYENNCMKWHSGDKLQATARKSLFSSNAVNQIIEDRQSEFSFKISPATFKSGISKSNSLSSNKRTSKAEKENIVDLTFTDTSLQDEKRLMDSGFSSPYFLQYSKRSDVNLGDCYRSGNWTVLPEMSNIFENPYKRKHSWSYSSSGSESFSPFSSSFDSSGHVQVIILPKETCELHGLSASVELMEVISLEDLTHC